MENMRPDGDTAWVHIGNGDVEWDINRNAHGGREAGQGHQHKCTRRTQGRTRTSTEMHTEDARSKGTSTKMHAEDARPDREINRNLHSLYFLK